MSISWSSKDLGPCPGVRSGSCEVGGASPSISAAVTTSWSDGAALVPEACTGMGMGACCSPLVSGDSGDGDGGGELPG